MQLPWQSALNFLQITGPCFTSYAHPNSPLDFPPLFALIFPLGSTCPCFSISSPTSCFSLPLSTIPFQPFLWNKSRSSERALPRSSLVDLSPLRSPSVVESSLFSRRNDDPCRNRKGIVKREGKEENIGKGKSKHRATRSKAVSCAHSCAEKGWERISEKRAHSSKEGRD